MTDTKPTESPLVDLEVFWMTRPSDGVRVLVMKTHTGENAANEDHECGVLPLTTEMAAQFLAHIELVRELRAAHEDLRDVTFYNCDLDYLGWDWDDEVPTWDADAGRTEVDRLEVNDLYVEWRAIIKHTDDEVATAPLMEKDLRAFVAGENPWPVIKTTESEEA